MVQAAKKRKRSPGRPPVDEITPAQQRTLEAIRDFLLEHSYPPTLRELGEILGLGMTPVNDSVKQLIRKGYLTKEPHKPRSLTLVREPPVERPTGRGGVAKFVSVRLYGEVAAGQPLLAEEQVIGEALVPADLVRGGDHFALKVKGDSMTGAGILDGDTVIVRKQQLADHGDIVVALLEDFENEATVKRLHWMNGKIELRPENKKHRPIEVKSDANFRILGVVVAHSRQWSEGTGEVK